MWPFFPFFFFHWEKWKVQGTLTFPYGFIISKLNKFQTYWRRLRSQKISKKRHLVDITYCKYTRWTADVRTVIGICLMLTYLNLLQYVWNLFNLEIIKPYGNVKVPCTFHFLSITKCHGKRKYPDKIEYYEHYNNWLIKWLMISMWPFFPFFFFHWEKWKVQGT
jgi:hypothetical protein